MKQNISNNIHEIEEYVDYLDDMELYEAEARKKGISTKEFLLKNVGLTEIIAEKLLTIWRLLGGKPKLLTEESKKDKEEEHSREDFVKNLKATWNRLLSNDIRIKFQPARINNVKKIPWPSSDIFIGLFILLAFMFSPFYAIRISFGYNNSLAFYISEITFYFSLVIIFSLYICKRRGLWPVFTSLSWKKLYVEFKYSIGYWILFVLIIGSLLLFLSWVFPILREPDPSWKQLQYVPKNIRKIFLLSGIIVIPFVEELFFRYFLYNSLKTRFPIFVAIILQAIVFASIHSFSKMAFAFFGGIGLALVYEKRNNLLCPIFIHTINNFIYIACLNTH